MRYRIRAAIDNSYRDEALLKQYDLKANDAILAEEKHMSLYEELMQNRDAKLLPGGAAQNTARGVQVCTIQPSVQTRSRKLIRGQ